VARYPDAADHSTIACAIWGEPDYPRYLIHRLMQRLRDRLGELRRPIENVRGSRATACAARWTCDEWSRSIWVKGSERKQVDEVSMPPHRYDDICDLCPPGAEGLPEPERVQHWRKHHPEPLDAHARDAARSEGGVRVAADAANR